MSRYGDNIRRLAEVDLLKGGIREARQRITVIDKAAIVGQRAIAYPNVTGKGTPGVTNPDQNDNPDVPNTTDKGPMDDHGRDEGQTDGDDLINGTKVLQPGEDPGALDLKDCETGEEIDVIMNTAANEGESKFKHPDGWSVDGEPGVTPGWEDWELGFYYNGSGTYFSATDEPSPGLLPANSIGYVNPSFLYEVTQVRNVVVSYDDDGVPIGGSYEAYLDWPDPTPDGWVGASFTCTKTSCASETGTDRCPVAAPAAYETWQDQDPTYDHQLAFSAQDGGFVSSSKDEGLPAKFRNDVGSGRGLNNLRLCTNEGNEVVVSALRDGTFAYFEEDGWGFPKDDARIFHFDSDGKYKDTLREDEYEDLRSTNNPAA